MIEIPNKAAHIDIIEETIGPIGKLWSLSIESKHKLEFILEIESTQIGNILLLPYNN